MNWDIDFYVSEAQLPNGQVIKRAGVGYTFRLLALLLRCIDNTKAIAGISQAVEEIVKRADEITARLEKEKSDVADLRAFLAHFVDGDLNTVDAGVLFSLSSAVLEFNLRGLDEKQEKGDGIKNQYILNRALNSIICKVAFFIHKDPLWVSENLNYVQCGIIIGEYNRLRADLLIDNFFASRGVGDSTQKHLRELNGLKTFAEAMNE